MKLLISLLIMVYGPWAFGQFDTFDDLIRESIFENQVPQDCEIDFVRDLEKHADFESYTFELIKGFNSIGVIINKPGTVEDTLVLGETYKVVTYENFGFQMSLQQESQNYTLARFYIDAEGLVRYVEALYYEGDPNKGGLRFKRIIACGDI